MIRLKLCLFSSGGGGPSPTSMTIGCADPPAWSGWAGGAPENAGGRCHRAHEVLEQGGEDEATENGQHTPLLML